MNLNQWQQTLQARFKGIYSIPQLLEEIEASHKKLLRGFDRKANYILCIIEYVFQEKTLAEIKKRQEGIARLRTDGHGMLAWWGGELPKGCQICLHGKRGFQPIRSVTKCNLRCKFCYYSSEHDEYEELLPGHFQVNSMYRQTDDVKVMIDKQGAELGGVAWVYFEPFTDIEKHYELIQYIHKRGLYQWMYTNGTLCSETSLKKLAECGLDELRFNLAATHCSRPVLENMRIAAKYVPAVGIESPMYREYYEALLQNKTEILESGIKFINCAELHLHSDNVQDFSDDGLYVYKYGYVSPVTSRHYTYDLMELAEKEGWRGITIHDCSNQTKVYRGILKRANFGVVDYKSQNGLPPGWQRRIVEKYPEVFEPFLDVR
ncbi:Radical SAM domain protein [Desulfofarcimen acetoxidans DSM 771]|jgi:pyruvate formate-lyase activating enzyme-like uncharacterized protein|uniref:Radical SAM domain protein n=1 Tax=Desulfofarcimen acetoxidans (strain ATCC 49208 / DSM 771 / KCTC 5769 / VKM B-1644 / 5575) TaxID=485916 RepID=C8W6B8_DESAS|nr:radical SAM protein [Desulfofarcimen acetoxidans]ACV62207.1 Radical SAM domain protein [Desulfofarcimen acetoxidans DSM 771]